MELLNKISESTSYVCKNAKHVKIDYKILDELANGIKDLKVKHWMESNPFGVLNMSPREIVNFLFIYHTIGDYCFWGEPKWTIKTEDGKDLDGSFAMIYIVLKRLEQGLSFDMNEKEFGEFLKANVEIPLFKNRFENLTKMNNFLKSESRDFYSIVEDMTADTELLEYIVSKLDFFKDEATYDGVTVYFYKRAQLLVSDILHIREKVEGIKVDYSNLLGCADYKIPQVMRCLGILKFDEELTTIVDSKNELKENDEREIEIRACNLVAIDYLYEKLNKKISRMDINDYIWLLGQDKSKITKPYHRTLTSHY